MLLNHFFDAKIAVAVFDVDNLNKYGGYYTSKYYCTFEKLKYDVETSRDKNIIITVFGDIEILNKVKAIETEAMRKINQRFEDKINVVKRKLEA